MKERDRQTDRQTGRDRDRQRMRDRERDRQTDRQRKRQRQTDRDCSLGSVKPVYLQLVLTKLLTITKLQVIIYIRIYKT